MSAAPQLPFVQLEFPGSAGVGEGRYLARSEGEASEGLVVATLGAERALSGRRRRHRASRAPEDPGAASIPVTRLTVVTPTELDPDEAERWLDEVSKDADAARAQVDAAMRLINRALAAQRAGAQDPYTHELDPLRAVAVRVGYGVGAAWAPGAWAAPRGRPPAGPPPHARAPRPAAAVRGASGGADEGAAGNWTDARELQLAADREHRAEVLQAQERVAAVLGGRDEVLTCEGLVLRAQLDLEEGRRREAALQLRVGLEALLRELEGEENAGVQEDLGALQDLRDELVEAANTALRGDLSEEQAEAVRLAIARCERALRRRRRDLG